MIPRGKSLFLMGRLNSWELQSSCEKQKQLAIPNVIVFVCRYALDDVCSMIVHYLRVYLHTYKKKKNAIPILHMAFKIGTSVHDKESLILPIC
jgi:hypothetical protein